MGRTGCEKRTRVAIGRWMHRSQKRVRIFAMYWENYRDISITALLTGLFTVKSERVQRHHCDLGHPGMRLILLKKHGAYT